MRPQKLTHGVAEAYLNWVTRFTTLKIVNSVAGRQMAGKVFDEKYWEMLYDSQFVFCPSGDFGWTYRFYEAMLAGACPIVDREDSAFSDGFFYLRLGEELPERTDIFPELMNNRRKARDLLCGKDDLSILPLTASCDRYR